MTINRSNIFDELWTTSQSLNKILLIRSQLKKRQNCFNSRKLALLIGHNLLKSLKIGFCFDWN